MIAQVARCCLNSHVVAETFMTNNFRFDCDNRMSHDIVVSLDITCSQFNLDRH